MTLASAGDPRSRALTSQYQSSIRIMRDQVEATFGRGDVLVNCAAINKREPAPTWADEKKRRWM